MKAFIYLSFIAIVFLFSCKEKNKNKEMTNDYPELAKKELTLLNQQYDSALINSDTAWLNKTYANEFIYTTPEGQVRNKTQQLISVGSGGLKLDYGKSDDVTVSIYDSTAIVTGRFFGKGIFKENIIDIKERYTTVWLKRDGKWQLMTEQGTFIQ